MRILHLTNHCADVGNGIMNVAVDLACEQRALGHDVAFASGGGSFERLLERQGVPHVTIIQEWRNPLRLPAALFALHRIVRHFKPDIIHAHMMTGAVLGRLVRTLPGGGKMRLITTVHNEWQKTAKVMILGDRVIAVSAAVSAQMAARGIPARKLSIVRNGATGSVRRTKARVEGDTVLRRPAILTVCGLYERKGVRALIDAFASLAERRPSAMLYIAGDGPDAQAFRSHASATPFADRIHFLGFQPRPHLLMAQADIFVLASRSEPFGLVLAEAREAKAAIVGTNVGGIPEVLEDGAAGILVPPNDPAALALALTRLLDDPAEQAMWSERASANLGWLSVRRMAEETLNIYREVLAHEPGGSTALASGSHAG
ncbi:MAG: glycosyltransferase family 4 protein [Beijerinckiaceae bacterium]